MAAVSPFETRGAQPAARFGHTMTVLSHSKALLFGGATGLAGKYTITAEAFVLDMTTRIWTNLGEGEGTPPSPRAAHAACEGEDSEVYIYGGATGGGSLASDDLFVLDCRDDRYVWTIVPAVGLTPGRRYGHTLCYAKPLILVFGGNTSSQALSDVWAMDLSEPSCLWTKLTVEGPGPCARAYHSSALCLSGPAANMMVIFGGRGEAASSLSDMWGLRKHRDGRWDWILAPAKSQSPTGRYQHSAVFLDCYMILLGGRSGSVQDSVPLEVYDTNTSEWKQYPAFQRFRHVSWIYRGDIYVHAGFEPESPNIPTNSLVRMDISRVLGIEGSRFEPSRPLPAVPRAGNRTPDIRMASHAIVSVGNGSDLKGGVPGELVRRVSIDRLQEEGKRLGTKALPPGLSHLSDTEESAHKVVLSAFLRPSSPRISPDFPISPSTILKLINQCEAIIRQEAIVVCVRPPVKIFGGLFGQYSDLMRYFDTFGEPSESATGDIESFDYLFLGDYVDRGSHSLEVIALLLALKVDFPDQITLLRGHHENRAVNKELGLGEECRSRLHEDITQPDSVFSRLNDLFEYMPLAAVLDDTILCVHGGIGKSIRHIDQIMSLQRPIHLNHPAESTEDQLVLDLLCSVPTEPERHPSPLSMHRDSDSTALKFTSDRLHQFLADNQYALMIRSHECVLEGFERCMGKLITVISATDYGGKYRNAGAMLVVRRNMEIVPKLLSPMGSTEMWRTWEGSKAPTPPRMRR